jgi:hypothetical protein
MVLLKQTVTRIQNARCWVVLLKELEIDATGPEPREIKADEDSEEDTSDYSDDS